MWVTKDGAVQDVDDGTFPYWRSLGWVQWEPDASGGSSPIAGMSAESDGTLTDGFLVTNWTVDFSAGEAITQTGDGFVLAAGVYQIQAVSTGDVTAASDMVIYLDPAPLLGYDAASPVLQTGAVVENVMYAVADGTVLTLGTSSGKTLTYAGIDLFRLGTLAA